MHKAFLPLDILFIDKNASFINLTISSSYSANVKTLNISHNNYILWILGLKSSPVQCFTIIDYTCLAGLKNNISIIALSCLLTNERMLIKYSLKNRIISIQSIFPASTWLERELSEFNNFFLISAIDTRRLLTDYTQQSSLNNNTYNLNPYSLTVQDLYMWMLHWLFFFSFCLFLTIFSFFSFNSSLLHLILSSEILIILLVLIMGVLAAYYNIYMLIGLATLLLVFGGLELSLNLLFFVL